MAKLYQKINGVAEPIVGGGGSSEIEPYIVTVTLNEDFAGQVVTFEQDGQETLTAVCPTSAPYEVIFKPMQHGVWTIKSTTISGKFREKDTDPLLGYGTYNFLLESGFDFNKWLTAGRVTKSFSSLDDILADEKTIRQLMTVHNSVDYIVSDVNEDEALKIFGNDLCAKWINLRDYALDTFYANDICKAAMDEVDKYGYGEWALMPQAPIMTSDTEPSGVVSGINIIYSSGEFFRPLSGGTGQWVSEVNTSIANAYWQYSFPSATKISSIIIQPALDVSGRTHYDCVYTLSGSNGGNFTTIKTFEIKGNKACERNTINFDEVEYTTYKLTFSTYTEHRNGGDCFTLAFIQFYAWQPKGNVPIMTANDAPYGVAKAKSVAWEGSDYVAFNGKGPYGTSGFPSDVSGSNRSVSNSNDYNGWYLEYKFNNPIKVKKMAWAEYDKNIAEFALTPGNGLLQNVDFKLLASNDGVNYETIHNGAYRSKLDTVEHMCEINSDNIDNDEYYLYYRIEFNDWCYKDVRPGRDTGYAMISYLQFYGRELSVSVPTMTSNTEPYGEVSASGDLSSTNPGFVMWKAFDKKDDSQTERSAWIVESPLVDGKKHYIQYKFPKKVCIKKVLTQNDYVGNNYVKNYTILGGNDEESLTELGSFTRSSGASKKFVETIENDNSYYIYRIRIEMSYMRSVDSDTWADFAEVQFYGVDYSERDFAEDNPSKYIYDHGVELEKIEGYVNPTADYINHIEFLVDSIRIAKLYGDKKGGGTVITETDLNNYNLARAKINPNGHFNYRFDNGDFGYLAVLKEDFSTISYTGVKQNNLPNNLFDDISNFNSVEIISLTTGSINTSGILMGMEISEWWLEK